MSGQFDKETSVKNFEWHRERALREKKNPKKESLNRIAYNLKAIEKKHGAKAANEVYRELRSR
jgi:hypothetical protein